MSVERRYPALKHTHVPADIIGGVFVPSGGTTAQFLRGDNTWSNTLVGPLTVSVASGTAFTANGDVAVSSTVDQILYLNATSGGAPYIAWARSATRRGYLQMLATNDFALVAESGAGQEGRILFYPRGTLAVGMGTNGFAREVTLYATTNNSYINFGAVEDWYIRPGTNTGTVYIGDTTHSSIAIGQASAHHKPLTIRGQLIVRDAKASGSIYTFHPSESAYANITSGVTGALKIRPPLTGDMNSMVWMKIRGYNYLTYTAWELMLGFYYSTPSAGAPQSFYNCSAVLTGAAPFNRVRFCYESSTQVCILLGDVGTVWEYPAVSIDDVQVSATNQSAAWEGNWPITLITSLAGITVDEDLYCNISNTGPTLRLQGEGTGTKYLQPVGTGGIGHNYGTASLVGSQNDYCGIVLSSAIGVPTFMGDTVSRTWGLYDQLAGNWAFYTADALTLQMRMITEVDAAAFTPPRAVTFNATTMTLNCALSNVFTTTFTANVTTAPTLSNPKDGQTINWFITQDGTGSRTMTWPSSFRWPAATAGVLSTTANYVDLLVATYRASTALWYATLVKDFR